MKTPTISYFIFLISMLSIFSCSVEDKITSAYMMDEIMGHTVKGLDGSWTFDFKEEFLDHRILSQTREEKKLKVDVEFILEDMDDEKFFYLHTILDFRLIDNKWIFIQGKQLKYKEVSNKSLPKQE